MFAVKANRTVSIKQGEWLQVQQIDHVPKTGLEVWLKDFGFVTLYRHHFKDQVRHYVKFDPKPKDNEPNSPVFTPLDFEYLHDCHWQIWKPIIEPLNSVVRLRSFSFAVSVKSVIMCSHH